MEETVKETRSIYIDPKVWEAAKYQAGNVSLSVLITMLLEKWMNGETDLAIKPIKSKVE